VGLTGRRILQGPLPRTLCATKPPALRSSSDARSQDGCWQPPEYNEAVVGYLKTAADDEKGVNLTDPEWRALIYVASTTSPLHTSESRETTKQSTRRRKLCRLPR
jgi:hypothetical protein